MMAILIHLAMCCEADDYKTEENISMSYTIEIRRPSKDGVNSKVAGQFTDFVWNSLWGDLQVPRRQWESWQSEQENTPLLADLPEVSKLAYIDEGRFISHQWS